MATTPLYPFDGIATETEIHTYQQKVESLTYLAAITRPDIAFCTKCLAEYLRNPGPLHVEAADHCIDYLNDTRYLALELSGREYDVITFLAAGNASFTDDIATHHNTKGYIFQLFGGTID